MRSFLARHLKVVLAVGTTLAAVAVYISLFVFGFHLIFFDDKVDEAGPVFASGAGAVERSATVDGSPVDGSPVDGSPVEESPVDGSPVDAGEAEERDEIAVGDGSPVAIATITTGLFVDRSHPSSGVASVLTDGTNQRFLRFEDFETDNGPDLNVYLSTAPADAPAADFDDDFIDLGELTGNIGSQNYEIPAGVDLDRYSTVVIWCVRFGVAFGAADLS